jgi:hypothetical protein
VHGSLRSVVRRYVDLDLEVMAAATEDHAAQWSHIAEITADGQRDVLVADDKLLVGSRSMKP